MKLTLRFLLFAAISVLHGNVFSCVNCATAQPLEFQSFDLPIVPTPPKAENDSPAELADEDISAFLKALLPENNDDEKTAQLIEGLSHQSFLVRDQATRALMNMPKVPVEKLQHAISSSDAEKSWRAAAILRSHHARHDQMLHQVVTTIRNRKTEGMTQLLIEASPYIDMQENGNPLRGAVQISTTKSDREYLLRATKSKRPTIRVLAVLALKKIRAESDRSLFVDLLKDENQFVRMEAAHVVASDANPVVLPSLVDLLDSDRPNIRANSANILRAITEQKFGFVAYDTRTKRDASVQQWNAWIDENSESVELKAWTGNARDASLGLTAICNYSENRVVILDAKWKQLREIEGEGPWDVVVYGNGEVLVAWYNSNTIGKYDASGEEVWTLSTDLSPWSLQTLANGNILAAEGSSVHELTQEGKILRSLTFESAIFYAVRTDSGSTVAALQNNTVVELDAKGKKIWQVEGLNMPYHLQRLENGNTLVVERGNNRVIEYAPLSDKIVFKRTGLSSPDSCQRLSNGNLLIAESSMIREYNADGEVLFQRKTASSQNKARRF